MYQCTVEPLIKDRPRKGQPLIKSSYSHCNNTSLKPLRRGHPVYNKHQKCPLLGRRFNYNCMGSQRISQGISTHWFSVHSVKKRASILAMEHIPVDTGGEKFLIFDQYHRPLYQNWSHGSSGTPPIL